MDMESPVALQNESHDSMARSGSGNSLHGLRGVNGKGKIQSVDRALSILEVAAAAHGGVSVTGIADAVGINISTCHHLVSTLVQRGYLMNLGRMHGYIVGPRILELAESAVCEPDPESIIASDLKRFGERLGYGIQFATLSDTSLMTKLSFPAAVGEVEEPSEIKKMTALHATATGKAILAWIPDSELARIISTNGMKRYTEFTICTLSRLADELRWVRRRKYAIDQEEFCLGVVCIGAVIREINGTVIGSISVTLPAQRADERTREFLVKEVIAFAESCSLLLHGQTGPKYR